MKNSHHMLRIMKKEMRKTDEHKPTTTIEDQMRTRLTLRMRKLSHPEDDRKVWEGGIKDITEKPAILQGKEAVKLTQQWRENHWRVNKGQTVLDSTGKLLSLCKELFSVIDVQESGQVDGQKLIWLFVALGIQVKSEQISQSIRIYLHRNSLAKLTLSEWTNFLLDKSATPAALQRLITSDSDLSGLSQSYEFRPDISTLKDSPDYDAQENVRKMVSQVQFQFRKLHIAQEKLIEIWSLLDPKSTDMVLPEIVAESLVKLGVAVEMRAARHILNRILGAQVTIQRAEFLTLFTRGILHLHIKALMAVLELYWDDTAHMSLAWLVSSCTRYIITAGLGYDDYSGAEEIVHKLTNLQTSPGPYQNYQEYQQFMAGLLLPPGYIPPRPVSRQSVHSAVPKTREESVTLVVSPQADESPIPSPKTETVAPLPSENLSAFTREYAEILKKTNPNALEGKIVFTEIRPVSDRASLRSTISNFPMQEKRWSLQDRLLSEPRSLAEDEKPKVVLKKSEEQPVVRGFSVLQSRASKKRSRRRNQSRATTAPSSCPRKGTASALRSSFDSVLMSIPTAKVRNEKLHSEYEKMVAFVPHPALGLFLA